MLCGLALWGLISLLAIFFIDGYPWGALGMGAAGGLSLGLYLWRRAGQQPASSLVAPAAGRRVSWVYQYEIFLLGPSLLILLFANRLPVFLLFLALAWLLLVVIGRKVSRGCFASGTPLDLPVLLLLFLALTSLYSSLDLRQSGNAVCMLVAGMALGHSLIDSLDSERKLELAFALFLATGAGIGLSSLLVMEFPPFRKLTLISDLYPYLPALLPRRIHPNYLAGTLAFFMPAAFWSFVFRRRSRIWTGAASGLMGLGLLMTQSRSTLLVSGVVILARMYRIRWVRWGLLALVLSGGILAQLLGSDIFLDPETGRGFEPRLAFRQEIWRRAVYIARDFPFTGIGLRSFPRMVDRRYPLYDLNIKDKMLHAQAHAHSLYLETVAALGIPGFVAFWALLGAWGGMVREVLRRSGGNPRLHGLALGLAGGMVAHLLYGSVDAVALGEKAGVVFWAVLGLTAAIWQRVRAEGSADRKEEPR